MLRHSLKRQYSILENSYKQVLQQICTVDGVFRDHLQNFTSAINPLSASVALIETRQLICCAKELTGI